MFVVWLWELGLSVWECGIVEGRCYDGLCDVKNVKKLFQLMLLDSFGKFISFLFVWCAVCNDESLSVGGLMYVWMDKWINKWMDG